MNATETYKPTLAEKRWAIEADRARRLERVADRCRADIAKLFRSEKWTKADAIRVLAWVESDLADVLGMVRLDRPATIPTTCPDCKATDQWDQFCRFCAQHFGPNTNRP